MPSSLIGQRVGEFEVVALIGKGGMGSVYEGLHPVLGKRVALKVLHPELTNDKETVERFLTEARAVNAIGHRSIIDIFSFGTLPDGACYFVMEFLDGDPFDVILKQRGVLEAGELLALLDHTLDALDAAHRAGIVHRDIKPSNLFRVCRGAARPYLKLLDFGVAKLSPTSGLQGPNTRVSMVLGTPSYMAPEQARGERVTAVSDLYSLGCVAFEALTGDEPFPGANAVDTMYLHIEAPVPSVVAHNSRVPVEIDALIQRLMAKEPGDRPQSAAQAKLEVEALLAKFPDEGLFLSPDKARTPVQRNAVKRAVSTTQRAGPARRRRRMATPQRPDATVMMSGTAARPAVKPEPPLTVVMEAGPMPEITAPVPMEDLLAAEVRDAHTAVQYALSDLPRAMTPVPSDFPRTATPQPQVEVPAPRATAPVRMEELLDGMAPGALMNRRRLRKSA